jgi:hypothetical protein
MKTIMKTFMVREKSTNLSAVQTPLSGLNDSRMEPSGW